MSGLCSLGHPQFGGTAFEFSGEYLVHSLPAESSALVPLVAGSLLDSLEEEDRTLLARIAASLASRLLLWHTNVSQVGTLRRAEEEDSSEDESVEDPADDTMAPGERIINLDDDDLDGDLVRICGRCTLFSDIVAF